MAALTDAELSAVFAALADPTRRGIVTRLAQGDCNVAELAQPFALSPPAITKHLKVLERAGLITRSRVAQSRPCHLQTEPMVQATGWMQQHRQMWDGRLDRLDAYLLNRQQDHAQAAGPQNALENMAKPAKK